MKLGEFLLKFRQAVKPQNNGKALSLAGLARIIGMDYDTLRSCEKGHIPNSEEYRIKLKKFIGVDNLEDISEIKLKNLTKAFNLDSELEKIKERLENDDINNNPEEKNIEDGLTNTLQLENNQLTSLLTQKEGETTMKQLLTIMELQALATDKDAEARLYDAKSRDRLSSILDRMEKRLEGEESMHVKKMGA